MLGRVQPDDDDVHVRLAARVGAPGEGAVGEGDLETAAVKQKRPELRHLLALRDRVGRDEADPRRSTAGRWLCAPRVITGADEPRSHVVERPAAAAQCGHTAYLRPLLWRLKLGPAERRIAKHV